MEEEETGKEKGGRERESPNNEQENLSKKGKSCKGCLYYSSTLKSNHRNPLCLGIPRSLPQVPRYIVGESEVEASKEGRTLTDFKYGCFGYSVYSDGKDSSTNMQESQTELPVCVGIEVLVDKRVNNTESVPAHVHNKDDSHGVPQPRTQKPAHPIGEEFLNRFSRNANLVANGVAKNMRKVGNHLKDTFDDILYPYRRPPK